jgi:hypothetical protein
MVLLFLVAMCHGCQSHLVVALLQLSRSPESPTQGLASLHASCVLTTQTCVGKQALTLEAVVVAVSWVTV